MGNKVKMEKFRFKIVEVYEKEVELVAPNLIFAKRQLTNLYGTGNENVQLSGEDFKSVSFEEIRITKENK